jgi:adenosine deaminase
MPAGSWPSAPRELPAWLDAIPKIELHVHLEGAIPRAALCELIAKYDGARAVPSPAELDARFRYATFREFLNAWVWKNGYLRQYEDFTWIAEAVARDLARQRIVYAEVFCSPPDFEPLETQRLIEAIRRGFARVPEIELALVPDLVRDYGPERGARELHELCEVRALGVLGIGIGGNEGAHPPQAFAGVYAQAREHGLRTSAHAGEVAGAASIWGALDALHVDRIGHGTHAEEDPALLAVLAERRIPLEMCPLSNVCTGSVASFREHPIRRYFERGLLVTVNTDDPGMFGNSLAQEYLRLSTDFGFTAPEIATLVRNALEASWLTAPQKLELGARLERGLAAPGELPPGAGLERGWAPAGD